MRKARQQSTMGKIFWEIYPNKKFWPLPTRTYCWGGGGEAGQPSKMGVFGQFSLARNRVTALHLATHLFLGGIILVMSNGRRRKIEHERGGDEI